MDLNGYLKDKVTAVDETLKELLPSKDIYPSEIHEAMHYSIFAGGKRLRPILCMAGVEALGQDHRSILPVACSLEMIHTYSLIHDDLPAMDNDDYRRGKPTNHKVFGQGIAILAGDALLTLAFEVLARYGLSHGKSSETMEVIKEISLSSGTMGMIGGQVVDIKSEGKEIDEETLKYIHTRKTGALFRASLCSGGILAGASPVQIASLSNYADKFGLAFQITDDLLDIVGDEIKMGKPVGSDLKNHKVTYPSLYGFERAKSLAQQAVNEAIDSLHNLPGETWPLEFLAKYLINRDS